jgi:general secretion pathway protein H
MRQDGYTLLELLVVMAAIGLLTAVAAPMAFSAIADATLQADARSLAVFIREQQRLAMNEQRIVVLAKGPLPDADLRARDFGEAAQAEIAGHDIVLHPDGTTSGGILRLREGSRGLSIKLAWLTGDVAIEAEP